jgi:hypothetical protein
VCVCGRIPGTNADVSRTLCASRARGPSRHGPAHCATPRSVYTSHRHASRDRHPPHPRRETRGVKMHRHVPRGWAARAIARGRRHREMRRREMRRRVARAGWGAPNRRVLSIDIHVFVYEPRVRVFHIYIYQSTWHYSCAHAHIPSSSVLRDAPRDSECVAMRAPRRSRVTRERRARGNIANERA